jgi:hypothetical protein
METSPWAHIKAEITFLPPSEGGRTKPPILVSETGTYRPHIVIGDPQQRVAIVAGREIRETYLGIVFVSGPDDVSFGEKFEAEAVLMYYPLPEHDAVVPGATFTIREGPRIVGFGYITHVFMPDDVEHRHAADAP